MYKTKAKWRLLKKLSKFDMETLIKMFVLCNSYNLLYHNPFPAVKHMEQYFGGDISISYGPRGHPATSS